MAKLSKFAIPANSKYKYPLIEINNQQLPTNSWFDAYGVETVSTSEPDEKEIMRCRRILVKPTNKQRELLKEWFDIYRYAYNSCVYYIKTNGLDNFYSLRPKVKATFPAEIIKRIKDCGVPIHTIDNAIKDAITAYKSSFSLHKGKRKFRIRYKKAKANSTITIESTAFSKNKNSFSRKIGIIETDSAIMGIGRDSKLSCRNGKYTLFIPELRKTNEYLRLIECCSLDPGVRTFQTVYCNDGTVFQFGNNVNKVLTPLIKKLDKPAKEKFKRRIRDRIKHLVDDLHWKVATTLCKISDKILIGNMSTVGVLQGNLRSNCKRILQSLSHYTFRMRLKDKCEEYHAEFAEVNESYTSKTCGGCGKLNEKLGSSKIFNCTCGFRTDRDINGARNIMIKHLQ